MAEVLPLSTALAYGLVMNQWICGQVADRPNGKRTAYDAIASEVWMMVCFDVGTNEAVVDY